MSIYRARNYLTTKSLIHAFVTSPLDYANSLYTTSSDEQTSFIYLGFLCCFQHCTGHITTGSWKGRGNQFIQFVRVLYCKLPTNGLSNYQLSHLRLCREPNPGLRGGRRECYPLNRLKKIQNFVACLISKTHRFD